jgi:arylsulfatase A-like enzyme
MQPSLRQRESALTLAAMLLVALVVPPGAAGCGTRDAGDRPNILFITLDTTRADRLSCYGYPLPTSPRLDALASESILYTRARSTTSWTLPAHASMFTGKYPSSHGAMEDENGDLVFTDANLNIPDERLGEMLGSHRARRLPASERPLAEILRREGYTTGAVIGGPWLKRIFGLDRGFDHYDDSEIGTMGGRPPIG